MAGARAELDQFKVTLADSVCCLKEDLDKQAKLKNTSQSPHPRNQLPTHSSFEYLLMLAEQMFNEHFMMLMTERPDEKLKAHHTLVEYIDSLYQAIQSFNQAIMLTDIGHSHAPDAPVNLLIRKAIEQLVSHKERLSSTPLPNFYRLQAIFPSVSFIELDEEEYGRALNPRGIVLTDDGRYALDARSILETAVLTKNPVLTRSRSSQIPLTVTEVRRVLNYFGEPAFQLNEAIRLISHANKIGATVAQNVADLDTLYKQFVTVVNEGKYVIRSSFGSLGWENLAHAVLTASRALTIPQQVEFIAKNLDVVYWRGFVDLIELDPNRRAEWALQLINHAGNVEVVLSQFDLTATRIYHDPKMITKLIRSEMWREYMAYFSDRAIQSDLLVEFAAHFNHHWQSLFKWGLLDVYLKLPDQASIEACLSILIKLPDVWQQVAFVSALPPSQQMPLIRAYLFSEQRDKLVLNREWQTKLELLLAQPAIEPETLAQFLFEYVPAHYWDKATENYQSISAADHELIIRYLLQRLVKADVLDENRLGSIVKLLNRAGLDIARSAAQCRSEYAKLAKLFAEVLAHQFSERYELISSVLSAHSPFGFDKIAFLADSFDYLDLQLPQLRNFLPNILIDRADLARLLLCLPPQHWRSMLIEKLGKQNLINIMLPDLSAKGSDPSYHDLMTAFDRLLGQVITDEKLVKPIKMTQAALYYAIRKDGPGHETWSASIATAIGIFAKPDKEDKCRACQLFMDFCMSQHTQFGDYLASRSDLPTNLAQQYAGTLGRITGEVRWQVNKPAIVLNK